MSGMELSKAQAPLAYRMSPRTLDEFVGQKDIVGKDKLLYRMIKADRLSSVLFWGPPGTGKTALARVIAAATKNRFEQLNAVSATVSDIRNIVADAKNLIYNPGGRVVLFIDEIHRFNKAQQDALLPHVEDGTVILVGATTENPYFEVNKALISRSTVFKFLPLSSDDIRIILENAVNDRERGLGAYNIEIDERVLEFLADASNGDARIGLNALELAVLTTNMDDKGGIRIDLKTAEECIQKRAVPYDKSGDAHYDNISAFIKSMRGSDPDAALFYMARALYAGEDPMFLARRIMICAAEDVGMADPQALVVAVAAAQAVHMVGMPEARIILAEAAVYVAASPKSNAAYAAIDRTLADVENKRTGEVPLHLRNAVFNELTKHGYGEGYKYAHNYDGNFVEMQFLPDEIAGTVYYHPTKNGYEAEVKQRLEKLWKGRYT